DAEMPAQRLDVGDEMGGRVVDELAERRRAAGAALVEDDDPVARRVEEAAMRRRRPRPRPAMQEDDGYAARVARLLPVERVAPIDREAAGGVRLDRREEITPAHRGSWLEGGSEAASSLARGA